jgi:ribonucleoside-triphosphate reductase
MLSQVQWWENEGQRALANNSVAFKGKPEMGTFMREWTSLYESKSGERGIFNRKQLKRKHLRMVDVEIDHEFGCNPCSEIILRPYQFCNLTEVVARETDSIDSLREKVRMATILGTFQSTLTNFKYLRRIWKTNTEEERLLGVSLTGILDCPWLSPKNATLKNTLEDLKKLQ